MRQMSCLLLCLCMPCQAEETAGVIAKVITEKGSLNLRSRADNRARVVDTIPNGTCILVTEEGETWCTVTFGTRTGYCRTEFLLFLREADPGLLDYRVLRKGMKGDDVLAVKQRLQEHSGEAFFLYAVAKPCFYVLWVLKEWNDNGSFRLERTHDQRAKAPD